MTRPQAPKTAAQLVDDIFNRYKIAGGDLEQVVEELTFLEPSFFDKLPKGLPTKTFQEIIAKSLDPANKFGESFFYAQVLDYYERLIRAMFGWVDVAAESDGKWELVTIR